MHQSLLHSLKLSHFRLPSIELPGVRPLEVRHGLNFAERFAILTSNTLPEGVANRLQEYESLIGVAPGVLLTRYAAAPLQYSLDTHVILASAERFNAAIEKLGGVLPEYSEVGTTYGFTYRHIGMVLLKDKKVTGPALRSSLFLIDRRVACSISPDALAAYLEYFSTHFDQSNHDPWHSIEGQPESFRQVDRHLRYGGIEFAPIVLHAEFVQRRLRDDPALVKKFNTQCTALMSRLGSDDRTKCKEDLTLSKKLYLSALPLRHLLLCVPLSHELVRFFLDSVQEHLFHGATLRVAPVKYRAFLDRDFSTSEAPDPLPEDHPVHKNRAEPYRHGQGSLMRRYLRELFSQYFGAKIDQTTTLPYSTYLLLDTLSRGHGIYAITSAQAESDERVSLASLYPMFLNEIQYHTAETTLSPKA